MSYAEQSTTYRDPGERSRMEMCVREQGYIYAADGRPDIAGLGRGVTSGDAQDIDAVIAAACVSPNWADLAEDGPLLAAVQAVWPSVAAARYPQEPE